MINKDTGLTIVSSNLGKVMIGTQDNLLVEVSFVDQASVVANHSAADPIIVDDVLEVLNGIKQKVTSNRLLYGTVFQKQVWNSIYRIGFGKTVTYAEIAKDIGNPKAVRAVGTACGANSIAVIIPCHRVIKSDGSIGKYKWGLDKKKLILEHEQLLIAYGAQP